MKNNGFIMPNIYWFGYFFLGLTLIFMDFTTKMERFATIICCNFNILLYLPHKDYLPKLKYNF